MSNIVNVLREEISRQARKELRRSTEGLKKTSAGHRSTIVQLNRRVATLEQQLLRLEKVVAKQTPPTHASAVSKPVRFSGKGLRKLRERFEISAPVLATILGVSAPTIYNWESGTTRPSANQIANIAALRGMTKRDVQARLKGDSWLPPQPKV